jgi:hypothetical protein
MRPPYACRYLADEYRVVGKLVSDDSYLEMTEQQFVAQCTQLSRGKMNAVRSRQIYLDLMKDAGHATLQSPLRSEPDDNGDHSWEYYAEERLVSSEEFGSAHTSYYAP